VSFQRRRPIRLPEAIYREDGQIYSITVGTADRKPLFLDIEFGHKCVRALKELHKTRDNPVYAYCLMPDHAHLLIGSTPTSSVISFVGAWKSVCYHLRRRMGEADPIWQRSFFDHALRRNEDELRTAKYILANPVRAGLAARVSDYPLSGSLEYDL
jgi:putative transposase